jgi:hypothetical protein
MKNIYVVLNAIKKIVVNDLKDIGLVFLPAEDERIVYRFFGLWKTVIPAKPNRWLPVSFCNKLDKYDNDDFWRTLHDIKAVTDYCLDEVTMGVYKKASVQLQMKNGDWITYGYYSTNEEAATVAKEIARKSPETFV